MRFGAVFVTVSVFGALGVGASDAQTTPYGSCGESAQTYQERYESGYRAGDLVCYQKALERELSGGGNRNCPLSAETYQERYEAGQRAGDLVCYQEALQRELGG